MPVKIRLQRQGRKKRPFYHIVVADSRAPRDGKYISRIGTYNPMTKPATIELNRDEAYNWLMKGAQPTDTARAILKFKGVYYKKHLMRGVSKGAMGLEEAEKKYQDWIDAKEVKIAERFAQSEQEKADRRARIAGVHLIAEAKAAAIKAKVEAENAAKEAAAAAEAAAQEAEAAAADAAGEEE
jgi:small subunit ribosomal protein S16